jgi:hypothetical protein
MGEMLRIEKRTEGCTTTLQLSGRFGSELIAFVRSVMSNGCARKILDLSDVTLVDVEVVRFLIRCDEEGIEIAQSPAYVREWMQRETFDAVANHRPCPEGKAGARTPFTNLRSVDLTFLPHLNSIISTVWACFY